MPEHTTFKSRACKVLETSYCSYNRAVVLTTEMMDDIDVEWMLLILGTIVEMGLT